jgi:hypothetical protein
MAKVSTKIPDNIKELIINNIALLIPLFTYIVFKFLKEKFFEGQVIQYIELFHMLLGLTIVYVITLKNICDKKNNSVILKPFQYALIVIFIVNIINMFNPCKESMTYGQSNMFFTVVLIIIFNIFNFLLTKEKDKYCKKEDNKFIILFLIMLNIALIYMKNVDIFKCN